MFYEEILDKIVQLKLEDGELSHRNEISLRLLQEVAADMEVTRETTREAGLRAAHERRNEAHKLNFIHQIAYHLNPGRYETTRNTRERIEQLYEKLGSDTSVEHVIKTALREGII